MKQFIFLLFLGILISSCKKEDADSIKNPTIVGEWKWFKAVSFFSETTPQSSGLTLGFIFNADSTCTRTGDLRPPSTGTYSLETNSSNPAFNLKISLVADTKLYYQRLQSSDTLLLDSGSWVDFPIYYFVRVR